MHSAAVAVFLYHLQDEDLFGDDDIFADIPVKSKPDKSGAKSAATKNPKSTKKSPLDDDMGKCQLRDFELPDQYGCLINMVA